MNKILCNASNLHVGGGVQVATSFFFDIFSGRLEIDSSFDVDFHISSAVFSNLEDFNLDLSKFNIRVIDVFGLGGVKNIFGSMYEKYDLIFTIFGPFYNLRFRGLSIVGFAQPSIIHNSDEVLAGLGRFRRNITRFKSSVQKQFFLYKTSSLVVEHEYIKDILIDKLQYKHEVFVVPNSVSPVFFDASCWSNIRHFDVCEDVFYLGYLGRNYFHKNTSIFPSVARILQLKFGLKVKLVVTFSDLEWSECSIDFRKYSINVGSLNISQCPSFYKSVDAIFFPSLLECFSITPIEAMVMGKKLFASDRSFVRFVCGNYPYYFDPTDPEDIANVIFNGYLDDFKEKIACSSDYLSPNVNSTSFTRSSSYFSLINRYTSNSQSGGE
ncbi:glycosyltransferase [Shewanella sp.]|uniref:glycosyltransferase n=1 Tax=Shewanella sp. TaxID=50422 RepID=UPI0040473B91